MMLKGCKKNSHDILLLILKLKIGFVPLLVYDYN